MHILVVEDEQTTVDSLQAILSSKGNSVQIAYNGSEGLAFAKSLNFDLILLDLGLPDMSGFEIITELRKEKIQTPILIVSGYTDYEYKTKCLDSGADDYLTKPFNNDELIARTEALVRRYRQNLQYETVSHSRQKEDIIDVSQNMLHLDEGKWTFPIDKFIHSLKRPHKQLILVCIDILTLFISHWIALSLRLGDVYPLNIKNLIPIFIISSILGLTVLMVLGFYRILIRSFDIRTIKTLVIGSFFSGILLACCAYFIPSAILPRSVPIIYSILFFVLIGFGRVIIRLYYHHSTSVNGFKIPIVIYGATKHSNQIAEMLSGSPEYSLIGFLDDEPGITGNIMRGRKVFGIEDIEVLKAKFPKLRLLLSDVELSPKRKLLIFERLSSLGIVIEMVPSLHRVMNGNESLSAIREIRLEDLLARSVVAPDTELFSSRINNKSFLITGGGGSIGSEICKQILKNNPSEIIILENNEYNLFKIERSLKSISVNLGSQAKLDFVLGDICDKDLVRRILREKLPDYVYHAAAYKHVNIVQQNVLAAVRNNVLGTKVVIDACKEFRIKRFTLVSSDKAVRPTNVMGATKRISELITQAGSEMSTDTIHSMVRFGNVLGSSGSVLPIFQYQIASGGPVTVTHPEVVRYFMTVSEAAQLVIQASFLAKGGEIFVLDMGEPVRIVDLAKLSIKLAGKTLRDKSTPNGEIAIEYVGLGTGEKLFEEILIGNNVLNTTHPKIMMTKELFPGKKVIDKNLQTLSLAIKKGEISKVNKIFTSLVEGYDTNIS